jgi:hypothetical protein
MGRTTFTLTHRIRVWLETNRGRPQVDRRAIIDPKEAPSLRWLTHLRERSHKRMLSTMRKGGRGCQGDGHPKGHLKARN